jgi:hypothetical protein
MAANINAGAQRYEPNNSESFEGLNEQPGEETPSAQSQISAQSEQSGNSAGGQNADDAPPPTAPPPPEESTPTASFVRYGIGDTVILGAPNYGGFRANSFANAREEVIEEIVEPVELPIDPPADVIPPSSPPAGPAPTNTAPVDPVPPNPDPADATPTDSTPIPMPKPGGNGTPTPAPDTQEPAPPATTNAPVIGGSPVTPPTPGPASPASTPTRREPYLTPGPHTQPDQSPHYATARAYGLEHGYSDDEIMKLAVLMQNNRDSSGGREWLALKPEVLRAAVNAVVRNPDNSFDISGVFGGEIGAYSNTLGAQRVYVDAEGHAYGLDQEGNRVIEAAPFSPPEGWVLQTEAHQGSDSDSWTVTYYRPGDELLAENDFPYLPLMMRGYMQVPTGVESVLSVGADGGVTDLSRLEFDPVYGLITPVDNYRPIQPSEDEVGHFIGEVVLPIIVTSMLTGGIGSALGIPPVASATSLGGAIAIGAANGVVSGLVNGFINDNLTFRGVFQSALTSGLTAGLSQIGPFQDLSRLGIDPSTGAVTSYALRALSITGQATIQGALRELVGGRFRDGFTQGIAQGLAGEISRALAGDIDARLSRQEITPEEAVTLRRITGFTSAAVRALANPRDPLYAFAQDFIGQLVGDALNGNGGGRGTGSQIIGTVFDDDGNLMPGIVDPNASIATQQQQLRSALAARGMDASSIEWLIDTQTEAWENADYANVAHDGLNNSIDTRAPIETQVQQLRAMLAGYGFDSATISDRVDLYLQQRQASIENDQFENTLNEPFGPQLASNDPRLPTGIVDSSLLMLSQKIDLIDRDLALIASRIRDYSERASAAAARGDTAGADAWNNEAARYLRYQSEYQAARDVIGIAREGQRAAESLYSNSQGYNRQQIDDAVLRLMTQQRTTDPIDQWVSGQLSGNMPFVYAALNDPENNSALAQAVRQLGQGLGNIRNITRAGGRTPTQPPAPPASTVNPNNGKPVYINTANGRLRTADSVIGQSDGGPGAWVPINRSDRGADYQEQISGVQRGAEYRVGDRLFDGVKPGERVLVDSKHWDSYPPVGQDKAPWFTESTLSTARGQERAAAGTGYTVQWVVSDQRSANVLRDLFARNDVRVSVVVVPKK